MYPRPYDLFRGYLLIVGGLMSVGLLVYVIFNPSAFAGLRLLLLGFLLILTAVIGLWQGFRLVRGQYGGLLRHRRR